MNRIGLTMAAGAAAWALAAGAAEAGERYFTYAYEPKVLPEGGIEFEPWYTARMGKASGVYNRWDLRMEIEFGLTDWLQLAVYLNTRGRYADGARAGKGFARFNQNDTTVKGISTEFLVKLLDPTADPIGLALYFEPSYDGKEAEWEMKLLLGKTLGSLSVAYNAIFEWEWVFDHDAADSELHVERELFAFLQTLGLSLDMGKGWRLGAEGSTRSRYEEFTRPRTTAVFAGPSVHFGGHKGWWLTLTVLAQLGATNPTSHGLELSAYERVEVRLLIGIDIPGGPSQTAAAPTSPTAPGEFRSAE